MKYLQLHLPPATAILSLSAFSAQHSNSPCQPTILLTLATNRCQGFPLRIQGHGEGEKTDSREMFPVATSLGEQETVAQLVSIAPDPLPHACVEMNE